MNATPRNRFIVFATTAYALLALAWIFLSDQMLAAVADMKTMLWLSTAKGAFFVVATAVMFFFSLRAVPPAHATGEDSILGALAAGVTPGSQPRWLMYAFAALLTMSMMGVREIMALNFIDRPLMILFMLPIILSALLGGLGPGLVSTTIAALGIDFLAMPPLHSFRIASSHDFFQWGFLIVNGIVVSGLSELLRQSLSKVESNRRLLDSVVSSTTDAVFVKNKLGHYLLANSAAARFIGKSLDAIMGRDDRALFPEESASKLMANDKAVMQNGDLWTQEERVTTHAGKELVFFVTKGPLFDNAGQVNGLFGVARDITESKQNALKLQINEERLQMAIDATRDGLWDWDIVSGQVYRSPQYYKLIACQPEDDTHDFDFFRRLIHPDDVAQVLQSIEAHKAGKTSAIGFEVRVLTWGGETKWMAVKGRIVKRDDAGNPLRIVGILSDITERKTFELAQREASTVFDSSYEGIVVVNARRRITKVNPAFSRITGYAEQDVIGKTPKMLSSGRHDARFYQEMWGTLKTRDFWRGEIWNKRKNGDIYPELLSISAVRDDSGTIQRYIGVFSDISQIKAHEAELDQIAHYDPLTGLPNRRLLADRFGQAILRSARNGNLLSVCFLDLDGFKAVNDQYGHPAGDQLLIGVAKNLKGVLRADDTLARLGGDEFVLLLSGIASPEECALVLDRILSAVSVPVAIDDALVSVSASIGVSLYPADNVDEDSLLRHADQAMYLAKEAGKNRYHLFDPESDRKAQVHRQYLDRLRKALSQQEFVLYYQPKVDLLNGEIVSVEALIRWRHPERGLLPPAEFLPHVNGSNLDQPVGEWVIDAALTQAERWHERGLAIQVSVNVSADHLLQADFCARLKAALEQHPGVPPAHFELEVLETAAIADMEQAVDVLRQCRELGVGFALDDFGTGYSSLTYLRKLPVDTLKIDQSFVRDMLHDVEDLGIVEGVIQLAGAFNRSVVAEGVETLEHGAALLRLGCRLAQGYGIARPMPAEQFPAWSLQWKKEAAWQALTDAGRSA
ncbi:MAG: EAL domain-containing protein [Burkholderiales bacterium]|nr:EAL domain-containing protein [Burkholderiales bacterium]